MVFMHRLHNSVSIPTPDSFSSQFLFAALFEAGNAPIPHSNPLLSGALWLSVVVILL
jgi:hypothetical protein